MSNNIDVFTHIFLVFPWRSSDFVLIFNHFRKHNLRFSINSRFCVPSGCIPQMNQIFFMILFFITNSFSEDNSINLAYWLKDPKAFENNRFFSQKCPFSTQKSKMWEIQAKISVWTPGENIWGQHSFGCKVNFCFSLGLFSLIFVEIWHPED